MHQNPLVTLLCSIEWPLLFFLTSANLSTRLLFVLISFFINFHLSHPQGIHSDSIQFLSGLGPQGVGRESS